MSLLFLAELEITSAQIWDLWLVAVPKLEKAFQ